MTLTEYGAWFDAFIHAMHAPNGPSRWAIIRERVCAIDGVPLTEKTYVDQYWSDEKPWRIYAREFYTKDQPENLHSFFDGCHAMSVLGQFDGRSRSI